MLRVGEDLVGRPDLDNFTEVHHRDTVTDPADHGHIVADEQHREVELRLEVVDEREDLRLDRHVERRDGLVGDDEIRVQHECPGQRDPLFLAAGELVGIIVEACARVGDPDPVE